MLKGTNFCKVRQLLAGHLGCDTERSWVLHTPNITMNLERALHPTAFKGRLKAQAQTKMLNLLHHKKQEQRQIILPPAVVPLKKKSHQNTS